MVDRVTQLVTLEGMSLRDEINAGPRGTKATLVVKTGLCKLTALRALAARQCGPETAELIAKAWGAPERWHELVVVRRRRRHQDLPPEGEALAGVA